MLHTETHYISHQATQAFGKIITDYLSQSEELEPYYNLFPTIANIEKFISTKQAQPIDRNVLVQTLTEQYKNIDNKEASLTNIKLLQDANTFTICTAHQPIIFGGPLYFIYKIAHAIHLASSLQAQIPQYKFVPIFYMGSEDADMDEIGTCTIEGRPYHWEVTQGGASGRMPTASMHNILQDVLAHINANTANGETLTHILSMAYKNNATLDKATLQLVHSLFGKYGLVVLIPDNASLKKQFAAVMQQELIQRASEALVVKTSQSLAAHYKVQAHARPINLFYLVDGLRERIELVNNIYKVVNSNLQFTEPEILKELEMHPERFSPNVILRGVFQESILPNIAFIGGGGELAYWLQLKEVFEFNKVPMPPLLLRQSFLLQSQDHIAAMQQLQLNHEQLFNEINVLHKNFITSHAQWQDLQQEVALQQQLIENYKEKASNILPQLEKSMQAYEARYNKLQLAIEKKFIAHSKRKQADSIAQINKLKNALFPSGNLQERVDNFIPYYDMYGAEFIDSIIANCKPMGNEFGIMQLQTID